MIATASPKHRWIFGILLAALGAGGLLWWVTKAEPERASQADASADSPRAEQRARRLEPLDLGPSPNRAKPSFLVGRVTDTTDRPLANATVCASPKASFMAIDAEREWSCESTDDQGEFRLRVFAGSWRVDASAPRHEPRWHPGNVPERSGYVTVAAGDTTDGVDFALPEGGVVVRGIVRDISGGPVAGAEVFTNRGIIARGGMALVRTGDDGRFELWSQPGNLPLSVTADGYATATRTIVAPGIPIEIALTPESSIRGEVVEAGTGRPVAGIEVWLRKELSFAALVEHDRTRTDAEGRFSFRQQAPGAYEVEAAAPGVFGQSERFVLSFLDREDDLRIEVREVPYVAGTIVIEEDSTPCPEPELQLRGADGTVHRAHPGPGGQVHVTPILPGRYAVAPACPDTLERENYEPIEVDAQGLHDQVWTVERGLTVRGRVRHADGEPAPFVTVFAQPLEAGGRTALGTGNYDDTDEHGEFEIRGLAPGEHRFELQSWGVPRLDEPVVVDVSPDDDDEVDLVLPATGALEGIVVDADDRPIPDVRIDCRTDARTSHTTHSDAGGKFQFERIAAGKGELRLTDQRRAFRLRAADSDDGRSTWRFTVRKGQATQIETRIEPAEHVIAGRVVGPDGAAVEDAFVDVMRIAGDGSGAAHEAVAYIVRGFARTPELTDLSGRYEVRELPPGRYAVVALRPGGGIAVALDVEAGSTVDLQIVETASIAGTLRTQQGNVPDRFEIQIKAIDTAEQGFDERILSDGTWVFEGLSPGRYKIAASAPEGSLLHEVDLAAGQVLEDVELVLTPRIDVRGRVVDLETGEPIPEMHVQIVPENSPVVFGEALSEERLEITDASGSFMVKAAPSGPVSISINPLDTGRSKSPYGWFTRISRRIETSGDAVDVGELSLVKGRLARGREAGELGFSTADSPPGEPDETHRFVVSSVEPGGPAATAGLAVGDEVVTVDGFDVSGTNAYRWRNLTRVAPGHTLRLGLADGRSFELVTASP